MITTNISIYKDGKLEPFEYNVSGALDFSLNNKTMAETQTTLKENELRIGNWVKRKNEYIKVEDIFLDGINACDDNYEKYPIHDFQYLEPIPLTPKILEKAGFEKKKSYGDEIYVNKYRALEVTMSDFGNEKYWTTFQCSDFYPSLQYLHQLQNLYFALTGEELEINL